MAASSSSRHNHHHQHNRSLSPSGRFCSSSISASSSFASSTPTFSSRSSTTASSIFDRSLSPTRVNLCGSSSSNRQTSSSPSSSVRFSIDNRATSPGRAAAIFVNRSSFSAAAAATAGKKKTCMCSPTTHPGSFRCNFHKNLEAKRLQSQIQQQSASYQPHRLNMRRSAMTNSLVRIGTVEGGEWVKRAVATLIRPSSHQQRRRGDFRPQPSRLSVMSQGR